MPLHFLSSADEPVLKRSAPCSPTGRISGRRSFHGSTSLTLGTGIYAADTITNVLPSMHVLASMAVHNGN